ncbi:glutamate receptor ionotropic, delta-2-like [Lycorma delicatula]|uniref:glutamate receptor ionotropic, delta-2-like n=1 Tax=Lycorma delicatula TaxID=130591 RepID=UPI003F5161E0
MLKEIIAKANHRDNPKILFLSDIDNSEKKYSEAEIIFSRTTNYIPDVLFLELTHNDSVLRYATFHYPPYSFLEPQADGTEYRIFKEFSLKYNCTLSLQTDDNMWGEIFENKSGNGILGNVYESKADVGFGALYLWYHEYQFLDYSAVYIRTGVTCLVPRVQQVSPLLLPLLPFDGKLWAIVLSTLIITAIFLYYVAKIANQFSNNWRVRFRTMADCVLRVIGILLLQVPTAKGVQQPPLPLRYIITWLEVMFLLIVTSYHSGLASNLTVHRYDKPIETVQDLVDSSLPWGARHAAWIFSIRLTQESNTKILLNRFQHQSFEYLKKHTKTGDFAFGIERLQGGFFAVGDYITSDSVPYLQLMKEDIYYEHVLTVVPKGSPYLNKINKLISQIQNAGLLLLWEREMARHYLSLDIQYGVHQSNVIETEHEPTGLQVKHILGSLIFLAIGHTIAAVTLFLEWFWVWKKAHHSNNVHSLC